MVWGRGPDRVKSQGPGVVRRGNLPRGGGGTSSPHRLMEVLVYRTASSEHLREDTAAIRQTSPRAGERVD